MTARAIKDEGKLANPVPSRAEIEQNIQRYERLVQWLDRKIHDRKVNSDFRSRVAGAAYSMTLEHQRAINLLIAKRINGSAYSLIRLAYETYVRGEWVCKCAEEADLAQIKSGKFPHIDQLLAKIENLQEYKESWLRDFHSRHWNQLCDYTHTGYQMIVRSRQKIPSNRIFPTRKFWNFCTLRISSDAWLH